MEFEQEYKGKITPQKALKMLNDEGMDITSEEATKILIFLVNMADVAVRNFLSKKEENDSNNYKTL